MVYVWLPFRLVALGLYIVGIVISLLAIVPWLPRPKQKAYIASMSRVCAWVLGLKVTYQQTQDTPHGVLLAANHISFMDIFVVSAWRNCRFVAKKELESWPLIGWVSTQVKTLYLDRGSARAAMAMGQKMHQAMLQGDDVIFFPEGTTGNGVALLPFHANLFEPAVQAGIDVVPVAICYTHRGEPTQLASYASVSMGTCLWQILTHDEMACTVKVLDPISSQGKTRQQVMFEVSAAISQALGWEDATAAREKARLARLASHQS